MNNNMQKGSTHSVEEHGKKGAFFFNNSGILGRSNKQSRCLQNM